MNKLILSVTITILSFALMSCNGDKIAKLEKQNQQLTQEKALQDSMLNEFLTSFEAFESNLTLIKEKENLISMETEDQELNSDQKDRIVEDIQMINELLDNNRLLIDELTEKVEKNEGKVREFRSIVSRMKRDLQSRDEEINTLKESLVALNMEKETLYRNLDTLRDVNRDLVAIRTQHEQTINEQSDNIAQKDEEIQNQTARLNKAFYVYGTAKELKEMNILSKEGGFVGIGKTPTLRSDFDQEAFTPIDITEFNELQVDGKKAKVITNHPTDSYVFTEGEKGRVEGLEIKDPERFWKASRYLVVLLN